MPDQTALSAVRESFERQTFLATIGAQLIRVAAGEVDIELRRSDRIEQQSGTIHGGAIASIADTAAGYAALTMMPAGSDVVSVEFKLNLLAPANGERLVARGRVVRSGKTLSVCAADVFSDDIPVATLLGTFFAIRPSHGQERSQSERADT